jgi:DNA mismatch repair protein MutL
MVSLKLGVILITNNFVNNAGLTQSRGETGFLEGTLRFIANSCTETRFLGVSPITVNQRNPLFIPYTEAMTSAIAALPTDVVYLIAAGEVIDSLAAVVRELAENALDAGATRISISIYPQQWRVRVADNGVGMTWADLQQAAAPHSTSKIHDRQDLWNITSLGFRGEALHSLAQLAQLEIVSRPANNPTGWHLCYSPQGEPLSLEPVAIAPGTVVTAHEIFASWSARREGLPPIAQQLRLIQATIHHLALCHPHVTWQVQQDDRTWFNLWAGKTARQILPQILRDLQSGDLQEWRWEADGDRTTIGQSLVLVGLPDRCHRHRPDWIKVALNGRLVQLPELEQTILASFRRMLPRDRFPVCFLHLQVPPAQIDWNRHPAKSEIYLHQLADWQAQVQTAIEQALQLGGTQLPESFYSQRVGKLLKTAESAAGYSVDRVVTPDSTEAMASEHKSFRAIAQVHDRYILVEHPTGVWLVEQHIAHERVLYEQLCDRWQLVLLESPIVLNHLTAAQVEQLQRLELDVEPFGEQVWLVRTAPEMLAARSDCAEALLELSLGGDLQSAQVATACRSAIRNGTPLTLTAMQTLIDQWQQTRHPRTCPHGRPICLILEESSLARFFRRHWVIGKSHGI